MNKTKIAVIGANERGKYLTEAVEQGGTHAVVYTCDETSGEGLNRLALLYHKKEIEMVIIANISPMYRPILNTLTPLGITECHVVNQFFYAGDLRGAPENELIAVDTSKPDLIYYETHIADHCNLNCKGCTHFCNLVAQPGFANLESYKQDLNALQKLYWNADNIRLMGGEPLLNPELPEFIISTRQAFPAANMCVVTNGLLLEKQPESLFQTMREYRCTFHVSAYPIIYDKREELTSFLARRGVLWAFSGETVPIKNFHKNGELNEGYAGDPVKSFRRKKCAKTLLCNYLKDGWLYPCGSFPFDGIFESHYGVKVNRLSEEARQSLRVNIRETNLTGWEINKILDEPHEACRYCNPGKATVHFPWAVRGKENVPMEDWLI